MKPLADGSIPPHHPNCLGCGPENPAGMGLKLRVDGDRIKGRVRLDRRQEGAPGIAHGGAIATVLDDALGTMLLILRRPAVTASLTVDFRSPAFLDRDLDVEAWCERIDGRKIYLAGRISDGATVLADCHALFLEVPVEHFERGGSELPDAWYSWKDMENA
ncbi:MAG: PaaI family thioesterase [Solirubrobacterales bacterium]